MTTSLRFGESEKEAAPVRTSKPDDARPIGAIFANDVGDRVLPTTSGASPCGTGSGSGGDAGTSSGSGAGSRQRIPNR
jgi:hypothetical protein